ncbi:MAG: Arc family DNA-binding protein [Saprospiraceae bacterium]|nr:Arc family DNA-binding protein [Saprospiraceae bacterium]
MGKKSFVLRVEEDTFAALEKWAADEFRSVNGQLEWIVSEALKKNGRLKQQNIVNNDKKENKND